MVAIGLLADHLGTVPTLAEWFRAQWPDYYARRTLSDMELDFCGEAQRQGIPMRLVALTNGELAGTIVLRDQASAVLPSNPALGGLFVPATHRAQGIGTELVQAGMTVAREQGYEVVYAATGVADGIFVRLGWTMVQKVVHGDEQLRLYSCDL